MDEASILSIIWHEEIILQTTLYTLKPEHIPGLRCQTQGDFGVARPCNFERTIPPPPPPRAFISVWTYPASVWDLNLGKLVNYSVR